MEHVIKAAVQRGASDLHIKAGDVFRARINGELRPLTKQRLTPDQTKAIALELITNPSVRDDIDLITDYDCSWGAPGVGRFRVNLLRQRSSFMIVMRSIPFDVPTAEKLRLPGAVVDLTEQPHGIIFVAGPTGSGKSSTIAALIHRINSTSNKHILTLEAPIEFLHRDLKGSVTQREVGVDTEEFGLGLRAALRQDPDVIVAGDVPDDETADALITGAETGRLVLAQMHTADATTTIQRFISLFPAEERDVARVRLSDTLAGVVSQRLLPGVDEDGRQVAMEIVTATPEVAEVVRARSRAADLYRLVAASRETHRMQTLDQHLAELVRDGLVTEDAARSVAVDEAEFDRLVSPSRGKKK